MNLVFNNAVKFTLVIALIIGVISHASSQDFEELTALINQGELDNAESIIHRKLQSVTNNSQDEIHYTSLLGDIYFYRNNFAQAISYFKKALAIAKKNNNQEQIANQYKNIGISHSELNEYAESLRWLHHSMDVLQTNNWQGNEIDLSIKLTLSSLYGYIGAYEQAMETVTEAQDLAIKLDKKDALGDSFVRLASIHIENKQFQSAIESLERVDLSAMNDRSSLSWFYSLYANTLIQLKQNSEAQKTIQQALNHTITWTEIDIIAFETILIESYLQEGNLTLASQALNDLQKTQIDFEESWVSQFLLAKRFKLEHKHKSAFETDIKAISLFFKHASFNHQSNNSLYFELPKKLIEATIVDAIDVGLGQTELMFELFYLAFLAKEPIQVKTGTFHKLDTKNTNTTESAVVHDILYGETSILFSDRLKAIEIQSSLTTNEGYIFYLSIEDNFHSMLISKNHIKTIRQKSQVTSIKNKVIQLLNQIETNNQNWLITAHQLENLLITPFRHVGLESLQNIHFIQGDNLRFLPMDLLIDEQGVLLSDRHDISINTVKSLKKYLKTQQTSLSKSETHLNLIGVSDGKLDLPNYWHTAYRNLKKSESNLPSVSEELMHLKSTIKNSMLSIGNKATETSAKHIIEKATGIIHFASHGFDNPIAPAYSSLVLNPDDSNDGLLQAREISKLSTKAQLVVLASCSSAKGGLSGLYGYSAGLAESFIHAGAKTVIGTLWDVKDKSTYQFMLWFYQGLSHNLTVSKALNFAKKQARKSGWQPYDWSAFILLGQADLRLKLLPLQASYRIQLGIAFLFLLIISSGLFFMKILRKI